MQLLSDRMIMGILILGLVFLGLVTMLLGYLSDRRIKRRMETGEPVELPQLTVPDAECCGQHATCEKDSLLAAVSKEVVYYDDHELDNYIGVEADAYPEEAVEAFREVFYTMRETDVAGWIRSLQLRGILLPDALKDEVFLVVGERRTH